MACLDGTCQKGNVRDTAVDAGPTCALLLGEVQQLHQPSSFSYPQRLTGGGVTCLAGTSDGQGNLLLGIQVSDGGTEMVFIHSDGGVQGTATLFDYEPFGQPVGFLGMSWGPDGVPSSVALLPNGSSGLVTGPNAIFFNGSFPAYGVAAAVPDGGMVAWVGTADGGDCALGDYGPTGEVAWSAGCGGWPAWLHTTVGADSAGNVVEVGWAPGGSRPGAAWYPPDGIVFSVTYDFSRTPLAGELVLTPAIGGGFFMGQRQKTGALETSGQWLAMLPPDAGQQRVVPPWLQARPNTDLRILASGLGYAVLPLAGSSVSTCMQSIEVVTKDGVTCGTVGFPARPGACTTGQISVGYDGTVIQVVPDPGVGCSPTADVCGCSWQWWPQLFH